MPAWLALTVQVPTPASDSVVPLSVQTLVVVDANDTARPDVDVANRTTGADPQLWLPSGVKVMV